MQTEKEFLEITVPEDKEVVVITVPEGVEVQLQHTVEEAPKAPTQLDNILTLGLVGVLALTVIITIIRKAVSNKKTAAAAPVVDEPAVQAEAPAAPGSAGQLKLHSVEPKTAAMLMAIVADKLGKPINELRFISIKEVE